MKAYMERRIVPKIREVSPATGFRYDIRVEMPGMTPDTHHEPAVQQLSGPGGTGRISSPKISSPKISTGIEGGFRRNAGMPVIVRGPGHMTQAHRPSDDVAYADVARSEPNSRDTFIRQMAERLLVKA